MMIIMKLTTAIITAILMTATPAFAAKTCGQRDDVIGQLSTKHSEQMKVGGLQKVKGVHALLEVWASDESGTFTVLLTSPHGVSCIVAAGTDFFEVELKPVEDDDPA